MSEAMEFKLGDLVQHKLYHGKALMVLVCDSIGVTCRYVSGGSNFVTETFQWFELEPWVNPIPAMAEALRGRKT